MGGVGGLMAGAGPTASRAMALNFGMLAFNASAKDALASAGVTGAPQVFGASAIAGFFAFLCRLSDILCAHRATCDDHTDRTGLHQEELGKGGVVRKGNFLMSLLG